MRRKEKEIREAEERERENLMSSDMAHGPIPIFGPSIPTIMTIKNHNKIALNITQI